jgi:L-lactate permease
VIAADRLHMPASAFLAVQTAGAAAGNAFCIANILAAKAVMGLQDTPEGLFVARTLPAGLLMCVLAQAVGLLFTLGRLLPAPTDVP